MAIPHGASPISHIGRNLKMQTLNKSKVYYCQIMFIHLFNLCDVQMINLFYHYFCVSWEDYFLFLFQPAEEMLL